MSLPKDLIFDQQAREKLKKGIDILTQTVEITLGPKGKNVSIDTSFGTPLVTSDGNSIAAAIELKDPFENMGVRMGQEVAQKMKDACGDGTTRALLLFGAIVREGIKQIAAGSSPIHLKKGLKKALKLLIEEIEKTTTPVDEDTAIVHLATVSASGDEKVGKTIFEAIKSAGKTGIITVEEGKGTVSSIQQSSGLQFDQGYLSPYFCEDGDAMKLTMRGAKILITDMTITNIHEILPLLETAVKTKFPLFIIATGVEQNPLSTLVLNKLRGALQICAVKAPGFGDDKKAILEDIAALTGATLITEDKGMLLKEVTPELLGHVEKIEVTKDKTTLITKQAVNERLKQLEESCKQAKTKHEKEKLEKRIANLNGKVAVIYVGASTEAEAKKQMQLYEDALHSTRHAIESGFVPGGGIALLKASLALKDSMFTKEEKNGAYILKKACEIPFRKIIENAGFETALFLDEVKSKKTPIGFNAKTAQLEDLIKAQIIEPAKLPISALTFAAEQASIVLLSEVLIADETDS